MRPSLNLLLIEDDPDDAILVRELIARENPSTPPHIHAVSSLTEGLRALEHDAFDLVLLDLSLPESRGLETLSRFVAAQPQVPVVVLTALNDESIALEALARGAQDYWVKGQQNKMFFLRSIRYAIERHRIRRELDATKAHLEELAVVDPLTGIMNRRGLDSILAELPRTSGGDKRFLAALIDLDDFKAINDQLGHAVGDIVLKEIARKVRGALRPTDFAARIGGDEFLLILPETSFDEGSKMAEKVRLAIGSAPIIVSSGRTIRVTASFGLVTVSKATPALGEILRETHLALANSKKTGKNKVSYDRRGQLGDGERSEFLADIRVRLRREGSITAVMQPIRRLDTMERIGYEFLSRSAIEQFTNPDEFFRVSLENNLLTLVDRQCLKACVSASLLTEPEMHCHLNLFPSTMIDVPVKSLLEEFPNDRPKSRYCIEISEQQIIGDPSYLSGAVEELKKAGLQVAIDDVGFGRTCLENLILLEPDIIKIDKKCVQGIAEEKARAKYLNRILKVADVLGAEVVAEGIETQGDLRILQDMGVQYGQGYLLDRPLETLAR